MAGRPADMDALSAAAGPRGIAVIEDAAQAHGARWRGRAAGSLGVAGSFSFQLSKNMSAGEGGIITVDDDSLAERCWSVHNCGRRPGGAWYEHPRLGGNERMTEWQAAVLLAQMQRLEEQTTARERAAARLDAALAGIDGIVLPRPDSRVDRQARHLYSFRYLGRAVRRRVRRSGSCGPSRPKGSPAAPATRRCTASRCSPRPGCRRS